MAAIRKGQALTIMKRSANIRLPMFNNKASKQEQHSNRKSMQIPLSEISDQECEVLATEMDTWADIVLRARDEMSASKDRELNAKFYLSRIGSTIAELFLVRGTIHTEIQLVCSRCGQDFPYPIDPDFRQMFSRVEDSKKNREKTEELKTLSGRGTHGIAYTRDPEDLTLDYEITDIKDSYIELGSVMGEQIELAKPFQPICQKDCKGICQSCGTNRNTASCQCPSVSEKKSAFSVLKDFPVQEKAKRFNQTGAEDEST